MKLTIDTENKTIKLEEQVGLKELSETLIKLFPNQEWKEYDLIPNTVVSTPWVPTNPWDTHTGTRPWWLDQPTVISYNI